MIQPVQTLQIPVERGLVPDFKAMHGCTMLHGHNVTQHNLHCEMGRYWVDSKGHPCPLV